ncbi:hypothetical protein MTF68_00320 [Pseudoalteromonas sp. 2CM37A]|uniref:hypothetical protein n=1 Tax=Pseudoalteromonas sp. 2CM37A TaxID=2929853 RepID=UPI0020BE05F4|nr:hypothetical protein [Pseudoalteromonas sp. 2CM37A]MCK8115994.1 hypothetical protein [Pseudoalteromonas sp. 2CM37A]
MNNSKRTHTLKYLLFASAAFLMSFSALSKDHKIILIHGLQVSQITNKSGSDVIHDGETYWQTYWNNRADERIDWPAYERIEDKIATDWVWPKLKQISRSNLCADGCVLVTHSTGDLVARHIIDNQANWLENAGLTPLNIVATFDLAGAGGGSELADIAVSALTGAAWNFAVDAALKWWLGSDVTEAVGVLHDLKVNNARKISPFPDARTPRLRFVADGNEYLGLTGGFLKGNDDSVVASHSSCGASAAKSFGSCSSSIDTNGQLKSQGDAVNSFMPHHYPMMMSDSYSHNEIHNAQRKGNVTIAMNNINVDGQNVGFNTFDKTTGTWFWKKHYRYIKDSNTQSASALIYNVIP